MGLRVELEMLAVLLLLTPLMSDGLLMPKCKLVEELELSVPQDVVDRENLVAELTCRAEIASQFETSRIDQVTQQGVSRVRKTRAAPQTTKSPITTKALAKSGTNPLAETTTKLPAKTTTKPRLDPYNNPLSKSNTYPPPKIAVSPRLNSYPNLSPKSTTNLPTKTTTNLRLKSSTNLPLKPYTNLPLDSNTNLPSKTKESRTLVSKFLDNPQKPAINQAEEEMYPPSNYPPMLGATPRPPPNFNSTYMNPRKRRGLTELWTLYGMFQLADRVACTSSAKIPSFNLCKLPCDMLTDNDIADDINCALTIVKSRSDRKAQPEIQDEANRLIIQLSSMLRNTCPDMDAAKYLAECQNP